MGGNYVFDQESPVQGLERVFRGLDHPVIEPQAQRKRYPPVEAGPWIEVEKVELALMPCVDVGSLSNEYPHLHRFPVPEDELSVEVQGSDLQPYYVLLDYLDKPITIDERGVGQITIYAQKHIPLSRDRFFNGFYSQESGGMSSFMIDPGRVYHVRAEYAKCTHQD